MNLLILGLICVLELLVWCLFGYVVFGVGLPVGVWVCYFGVDLLVCELFGLW